MCMGKISALIPFAILPCIGSAEANAMRCAPPPHPKPPADAAAIVCEWGGEAPGAEIQSKSRAGGSAIRRLRACRDPNDADAHMHPRITSMGEEQRSESNRVWVRGREGVSLREGERSGEWGQESVRELEQDNKLA